MVTSSQSRVEKRDDATGREASKAVEKLGASAVCPYGTTRTNSYTFLPLCHIILFLFILYVLPLLFSHPLSLSLASPRRKGVVSGNVT